MGFLIRCIFWFSLVLLFLPFGMQQQDSAPDPISPFQAIAAVRDAARDVADICARQPDVCATAHAAVQTITARAKEGMRIAQELVDEQQEADQPAEEEAVSTTGSVAAPEQVQASPAESEISP